MADDLFGGEGDDIFGAAEDEFGGLREGGNTLE